MHKRLDKGGFTIVELIVVMAVLAILVLIATPKLLGFTEEAKETQIRHDLRVVENVIEEYLAKHNELPEALKIDDVEAFLLSHKIYDANGLVSNFEVGDEARGNNEIEVASLDSGIFMSGEGGEVELYDISLMNEVKAIKTKINGKFISNNDGKVYNAHSKSTNPDDIEPPVQEVVTFIQSVGGSETEHFYSATGTSDGGYIAVGYSYSNDKDLVGLNKGDSDAIIVKFDSYGNKKWIKTVGGSGRDYFKSLIETTDGEYIAVGYSPSIDRDLTGLNKGRDDAIIAKFDINGNMKWLETIGGSNYDYFESVVQTSDGEYIAVGRSSSNDKDLVGLNKGSTDALIVKFDNNGNKKWIRTIGGVDVDGILSIVEISDGGYIAVGYSYSNDKDLVGLNKGDSDAIIVKLDSNGNKKWIKSIGGSGSDVFRSVVEAKDGGYIVVGNSYSINGDLSGLNKGDSDAIIVKFDVNGNRKWIRSIGGSLFDNFNSVAKALDGGYIATGSSASNDKDFNGLNKGSRDIIIVKFDINGDIKWIKDFGGNYLDDSTSIKKTLDGGYIISGYSSYTDWDLFDVRYGKYDAIIIKLDSNGDVTK